MTAHAVHSACVVGRVCLPAVLQRCRRGDSAEFEAVRRFTEAAYITKEKNDPHR